MNAPEPAYNHGVKPERVLKFWMAFGFIAFLILWLVGCAEPERSNREIFTEADTLSTVDYYGDSLIVFTDSMGNVYKEFGAISDTVGYLIVRRRHTDEARITIIYFASPPSTQGSGEIPTQIGHTP